MAFNYDASKFKEAYNKAKENNYSNDPLPEGTYHVKVEKLEVGETKDGVPMGKIQFRILEGQYKNKCLFMNQVLFGQDKEGNLTAFGVKIFDDFIESLEPSFDDYKFSNCNSKDPVAEYTDLILDVAEDIENLQYDIKLSYKEVNGKQYAQYKVVEVYE